MTELDDHRELLNAIVETIHGLQKELESIRETLDLVRTAQVEHGKALEDLRLKVDRQHRPSVPSSSTPLPILSKIGSKI